MKNFLFTLFACAAVLSIQARADDAQMTAAFSPLAGGIGHYLGRNDQGEYGFVFSGYKPASTSVRQVYPSSTKFQIYVRLSAPEAIPARAIPGVRGGSHVGEKVHLKEFVYEARCASDQARLIQVEYYADDDKDMQGPLAFASARFDPATLESYEPVKAGTILGSAVQLACKADLDPQEGGSRAQMEALAIQWRKQLKRGEESNCGTVIEVKPPLAQVQTPANGLRYLRISELLPAIEASHKSGDWECIWDDAHGGYVPPVQDYP